MAHRAVNAVIRERTSSEGSLTRKRINSLRSCSGGSQWVPHCAGWLEDTAKANTGYRIPLDRLEVAFESSTVPGMPIETYLAAIRRVGTRYNLPDASQIWETTFILLLRLSKKNSTCLTPHTIHRLVLTAFTVAMKLTGEKHISNASVAAACGVSLANLNEMERALLELLNWELCVSREEYVAVIGEEHFVATFVRTGAAADCGSKLGDDNLENSIRTCSTGASSPRESESPISYTSMHSQCSRKSKSRVHAALCASKGHLVQASNE